MFVTIFVIVLRENKAEEKHTCCDRDRTRTCNPQIRSLMPYPLGHTAAAYPASNNLETQRAAPALARLDYSLLN